MQKMEKQLMEAFDQLWGDFVDPREPYWDGGSGEWASLGSAGEGGSFGACEPFDEASLANLRRQCRGLAASNEYAINGHENRISYIVGSGHTYRASVKKGTDAPEELAGAVQLVLDEFLRENHWHRRQQEIVRRMDRDGEAFLRFFVNTQGVLQVRFVEPDQVLTPTSLAGQAHVSFGIENDPEDVETVLAYYVDGQSVAADEIQHRKANVDGNVKRGVPLFAPVRKNLRRAEKLLRNMSVLAEIQSAIALIRKHRSGVRTTVQQFVSGQADATATNGAGQQTSLRQYRPGTILDAPQGLEYDFPATGIDAGSYVTVLQAELRAIASRLVMPEFMLSSDASNANYASTLVAEGPALKMFERLQSSQVEDDLAVMRRSIDAAARVGRLPSNVLRLIEIQATPPTLAARDRLEESRINELAFENGILSSQTWSQKLGLDYDQEQKNIQGHGDKLGVAKNRG